MSTIKEVLEYEIKDIERKLADIKDTNQIFLGFQADLVAIGKTAIASTQSVEDTEKKVAILIQAMQAMIDNIATKKIEHENLLFSNNAKIDVLNKLLAEDKDRTSNDEVKNEDVE